jgi:predicted dehydrogenase
MTNSAASSNKVLNIGIIGCGLIGQKRAAALGAGGKLVACADTNLARAVTLAKKFNAEAYDTWQALIARKDIDAVVIATLHDSLAEITLAAVESGKHVLVEKPAARNPAELAPVIAAAKKLNRKVHVGFNHRYHRALQKAKALIDSGAIGDLMFIRARYGHGARVGYDKEWRSDPKLSGGGELIDQGPHVIDLSRWFMGEFTEIDGYAHTYYWDMPVDDNAFLTLKTAKKQVAFLQVSCTEWKNTFSMEIYGKAGKLDLNGLGGSYGVERLTWYKMLPEMGPPETTAWEYPMGDNSWALEMAEFYDDIHHNREPAAGLNDALAALTVIQKIYKESGYDFSA